ncbi:MAG: XRE family transcriptional regulator [Nostoc sp.]|uniref:XRE family transcriptional regulator n=1 Tax=Nostoc sp. TaxID=1180 RepID=UPI002FF7691F
MTHSVNLLVAKQHNIGILIRALRQELNISKERFAAELSVTFLTINFWEIEMEDLIP